MFKHENIDSKLSMLSLKKKQGYGAAVAMGNGLFKLPIFFFI